MRKLELLERLTQDRWTGISFHCDSVPSGDVATSPMRLCEAISESFERTFVLPQEMIHFVNCVLGKETCMETGEDGRDVLEIMYAAYQSAGEGRKITFPYDPPKVKKPIDLWKKGA